jgi:DNA-binding transcriptional LysR family regulator
MRKVNLKNIDLNLLVLLDALIEHRNVTRAAELVNMSQPAMSRALGRIRLMLKDPVLVRGADGLVPTPKAMMLQPHLKRLLAEIEELISDIPFNPALLDGVITLSGTDYQMMVLLPGLIARISQEAPQLDVKVVPLFKIAPEHLDDGTIDLAFGVMQADLASNLCQEKLYCDRYITLMRAEHPLKNGLSVEDFASQGHILVTALGDGRSAIDTILDDMGLKRRITLQVPNFLTAMQVVARSDLLLTLPSRIAASHASQHNLVTVECAIAFEPIQHVSIWSKVRDEDPLIDWLRNLVHQEAEKI